MERTLPRAVYNSPVSRAVYLLSAHSACNQLSGGHCPPPGEGSHLGTAVSWSIGSAAGGNSQHTRTLIFSFCCLKWLDLMLCLGIWALSVRLQLQIGTSKILVMISVNFHISKMEQYLIKHRSNAYNTNLLNVSVY